MREIKFRIFDKNIPKNQSEKELEKPSGIILEWNYILNSDYLKDALIGKYPIMQYTGIKDINGKEIYKGDVVKVIDENDEIYGIGAVEFCCGCWYVGRSIDEPLWDLKRDYLIEVIGNIYENPELLEQKR